jgi:hypothetical protein
MLCHVCSLADSTKILKESAAFWSEAEGKKFFQNPGTYL